MNIKKECYLCIYNQVYKIASRFDEITASKILREGAKILSQYSLDTKPPEIAADEYDMMGKIIGKRDIYEEEKKLAIQEALKFKPILKKRLEKSKNRLFDAIKIAVSGNVIDLGVNQSYNLEKEIKNIFRMDFKRCDFEEFNSKLQNAKSICYLADNAGENVFDEILIEELAAMGKMVYYVVRGAPIINDVTVNDLKGLDIFKYAEVIDSGVDTPGFCLERVRVKAEDVFFESDLVISKGMGNFECLFGESQREVFYLFKVKCSVVAKEAKAEVGDYIFLKDGE
ncbi:MAG: DUF89 family protein [Epsilonproteobacteria bacterium]|nr:DUF89 family protein [Campylobacterota bacterium]